MRYLIDSNKVDADDKMKDFRDKLASILDKLVENCDHIFHQVRISSPDNDVEDYGISEITKSASETRPSNFNPSFSQNPTHMIKVAHFHKLMSHPWHIVTLDDLEGVSEDNI